MDKPDRRQPPSLAEEQRQRTRSRIRRAAVEVVARRGFDATVEEIAQLSGVSPRTISRHYGSHDQLIVAAVEDMFEAGDRPIENLPSYTDNLDGWLEVLTLTAHTRNAEILGDAFWDLNAPNRKMSEALSEVGTIRRAYRRSAMLYLVTIAWQTAGGGGEPPKDLVLAFTLNFSAFTTQALMVDSDQTPAQIGALTADILKVLLRRAVEAQCSGEAVAAFGEG